MKKAFFVWAVFAIQLTACNVGSELLPDEPAESKGSEEDRGERQDSIDAAGDSQLESAMLSGDVGEDIDLRLLDKIFEKFDSDSDGGISKEEFGVVLKKMKAKLRKGKHCRGKGKTVKHRRWIHKCLDEDKDGVISDEEKEDKFEKIRVCKDRWWDRPGHLKDRYKECLDENDDGQVDEKEMENKLEKLARCKES